MPPNARIHACAETNTHACVRVTHTAHAAHRKAHRLQVHMRMHACTPARVWCFPTLSNRDDPRSSRLIEWRRWPSVRSLPDDGCGCRCGADWCKCASSRACERAHEEDREGRSARAGGLQPDAGEGACGLAGKPPLLPLVCSKAPGLPAWLPLGAAGTAARPARCAGGQGGGGGRPPSACKVGLEWGPLPLVLPRQERSPVVGVGLGSQALEVALGSWVQVVERLGGDPGGGLTASCTQLVPDKRIRRDVRRVAPVGEHAAAWSSWRGHERRGEMGLGMVGGSSTCGCTCGAVLGRRVRWVWLLLRPYRGLAGAGVYGGGRGDVSAAAACGRLGGRMGAGGVLPKGCCTLLGAEAVQEAPESSSASAHTNTHRAVHV